jgi:predicted permease
MRAFLTSVRYAIRGFRHSPGFALIAILSLALGIGANTAIFSLLDRVLMRSLPVKDAGQLVLFSSKGPRSGNVLASYDSDYTFSYPLYKNFRDHAPALNGVIAFFSAPASISVKGQTEYAGAHMVSGNYFDVLGMKPALGRLISPQDERTTGEVPVAVLSNAFWARRFGSDSAVLNQSLNVNGHPMTIIGVAPPDFKGLVVGEAPAIFVPVTMEPAMLPGRAGLNNRRSMWLNILARLQPGTTGKAAEAAVNAFWRPLLEEDVKELQLASANARQRYVNQHLTLMPAGKGVPMFSQMFEAPLVVLMTLVGLVLLIACANVANLLLARAAGRRKEIAVRLALGARRRDLIRQVLTESLILAVAGGGLGILLASWTSGLLLALLPFDNIGEAISTDPDLRILAFTAGLSIVCAILFGLAPALQSSGSNLADALKQQASNVLGNKTHERFRKGLVVTQVALSLLLLVGAGLFMRSVQNLEAIDTGFRQDHLMGFSINPSLGGYSGAKATELYDQLYGKFAALPGVRAAAASATPLLTDTQWVTSIVVPGYEKKENDRSPNVDAVSPGFFSAMAIPMIAGREFTAADGASAPKVAVVNEAFARMYFGGANPVGRYFYYSNDKDKSPIEIVGLVKNGKYADLREKQQVFLFRPYSQHDAAENSMTFYVRTTQSPALISTALREAVRSTDPNLPVFGMKTMEQQIGESVFLERLVSGLSAFFGGLATLLAAIGLYGVMSYVVTRRTREIGVRMALGADRGAVLKLVMAEVALIVGIGVAIALPAAFPLTKLAQSQLYGVGAHDPGVMAGATVLLAVVALLAGYIPAARATRVDPINALRSE